MFLVYVGLYRACRYDELRVSMRPNMAILMLNDSFLLQRLTKPVSLPSPSPPLSSTTVYVAKFTF